MASTQKYSTAKGTRWMVRYRKPGGAQTDKRGFLTKKAAEVWAAENLTKIMQGSWIDPLAGRVTVGELGPAWIARQKLKPSARKPISIAWRHRVEPRWGDVSIGEIRPTEVQDWLSTLTKMPRKETAVEDLEPLAATGVIYAHQVLHGILADAMRDRLIGMNPADDMDLPRKGSKRKLYLTHEQLHAFAEAIAQTSIDADARAVLALTLGYTGVRWGEATGLRVRGVNALRKRLVVRDNAVEVDGEIIEGTTKSHRERTVPVPAFLMSRISALCVGKGPDELVWSKDGAHLPLPPYTRGWWQQSIIRAELPRFTPHDLRHTAASLAVQSGANVKAIQKMLGHSSAAMTLDVYADLFDDDLDDVANRLDTAVGEMWAKRAT